VYGYPHRENRCALFHHLSRSLRLRSEFVGMDSNAGSRLSLRLGRDSQYISDDIRDQTQFWSMEPSYAFVADRFNRIIKEEPIHGYSSKTRTRFVRLPQRSRMVTITTDVLKFNHSRSHPGKTNGSALLALQKRIQTPWLIHSPRPLPNQ
jgi:hypothetical protein